MKRITIVVDENVKYRILEEIQQMGAAGYTEWLVHGKGARGARLRHGDRQTQGLR